MLIDNQSFFLIISSKISDIGEVEVIINDHEYDHFEPDTVNDDIGPSPMSISRENSNLSINITNNNSTNNNSTNTNNNKNNNKRKSRRPYAKNSWVWCHFKTSEDGMFNICNVTIEKTTDNNIICGSRFVNDGSTGNMGNHLRCKHDLSEEKRQKVM